MFVFVGSGRCSRPFFYLFNPVVAFVSTRVQLAVAERSLKPGYRYGIPPSTAFRLRSITRYQIMDKH